MPHLLLFALGTCHGVWICMKFELLLLGGGELGGDGGDAGSGLQDGEGQADVTRAAGGVEADARRRDAMRPVRIALQGAGRFEHAGT